MGTRIRGRWQCMMCLAAALLLLGTATVGSLAGTGAPLWVSCSAPTDLATAAQCGEYAGAILDATLLIRLVSRCSDRSGPLVFWYDSHGTILDDRTLLTHHHYLILEDASCTLRAAVFYNSAGHVIKTISDPAHLASIEGQLRSQSEACRGEFCMLELAEPSFTPPRNVSFACPECEWLAEQMVDLPEVAVINWEGYPGSTYVQWAHPEGFATRGDVPVLEVASDIQKGASGGGAWIVTVNGMTHIGNCWRRVVDGTGSVVALNPSEVGE